MEKVSATLYELLAGNAKIDEAIYPTVVDHLHVLPSNQNLAAVEIELAEQVSRETYLKNIIDPLTQVYDYIVIDCPPSLGLLTLNSLVASDFVLIPVQCEYFALEGIHHLVSTLENVRLHYNPGLDILGIVLTMFDSRTSLNREVVDSARRFFKRLIFQTIIPRNIKLAEAPSHGIPIMSYQPHCMGAEAYFELSRFRSCQIKKILS